MLGGRIAPFLLVSVALLGQPAHAQATPGTRGQAAAIVVRGLDGRDRTITPADLARLTRHDTTVSAHQVSGRYSGVALRDVIALADAPPIDSVRGRALTTYVVVEAADGYRVTFLLAELDPGFTDRIVIPRRQGERCGALCDRGDLPGNRAGREAGRPLGTTGRSHLTRSCELTGR